MLGVSPEPCHWVGATHPAEVGGGDGADCGPPWILEGYILLTLPLAIFAAAVPLMKTEGCFPALCACLLLGFTLIVSPNLRGEEPFPLRDITETVDDLLGPNEIDLSELAYVSARGMALYSTVAIFLNEWAVQGRGDKKVASNLESAVEKFHKVARVIGLKTGKSEKAILEQIVLLSEIYAKEMVRSKQLNNEIMSPVIKRDMQAISKAAPLLVGFADELTSDSTKEKK
jgi:hypothetical protein